MNYLYFIAALGGALFVAVNLWAGWADVAQAVEGLGWGVALIIVARVVATIAGGLALQPLTDIFAPLSLARATEIRWVRDAVNNLLPVASVGGEIVGARLLSRGWAPLGPAGASVLVDFSMQIASQLLFTFVGLGLLAALGMGGGVAWSVLVGLLIFTPAIGGFLLAQRKGGLHWTESALKRLAQRFSLGAEGELSSVSDSADILYAHRLAVAQTFGVHLAIWFMGAVEIYIGLWFLGLEARFATAVVIESLGQAVKGAAFSVPGAVGVQEGGFIVLCAVFGIGPADAIALSLAKRAPDIALGVVGLVYWQVAERRGRITALSSPP